MHLFSPKYSYLETKLETSRKFVSKMKYRISPRSDVNKNGKSLLYLVLTNGNEKKAINLNLYVKKEEWSFKEQRLKPKNLTKKAEAINIHIGQLEAKIESIKLDYFIRNQVLTIDKFIDELNSGFSRVDFLQFAEAVCRQEDGVLAKRSNMKRRSVIEKIRMYKKVVLFSDIDKTFIQGYIRFWKKQHIINGKKVGGNKMTTINSDLKVIKKWLRIAKKNAIRLNIDIDDIVVGSTSGSREYLTDKELILLTEFYFSKFMSDRYKLTVGIFLFGCFTSLRISDMKQLKREDFEANVNGRPTKKFTVTKTKKTHTIKFNESALKIVKENPDLFKVWKSEQKMNQEIKEVMKILKIKKNISLHCARHTFATNYLRLGGKVEVLQKILGHSSINETMIYVRIYESEKENSIDLLDNLFN